MVAHDWFDWTNSGIGVAGLALTVGAIRQATGAKRAAIEARDKISRRDASDEIVRIERLTWRLQDALQSGQNELFSHIAHEFITECSRTRERYRRILGVGAGNKLDSAISTVRWTAKALHQGARPGDFLDDLGTVAGDLSSVIGWLGRRMDEEGQ